jgi:hypothetical protein
MLRTEYARPFAMRGCGLFPLASATFADCCFFEHALQLINAQRDRANERDLPPTAGTEV